MQMHYFLLNNTSIVFADSSFALFSQCKTNVSSNNLTLHILYSVFVSLLVLRLKTFRFLQKKVYNNIETSIFVVTYLSTYLPIYLAFDHLKVAAQILRL